MIQKWVSPKAFSNGISVLNILIKELVLLVTSVNLKSSEISSSLISTLKFQFEKIDKFNNITVAIFNAYLISTLKFENIKHLKNQFEKKEKFNNVTSAMFNAYLISTLKFENIKHFLEIPKIWKNKISKKSIWKKG